MMATTIVTIAVMTSHRSSQGTEDGDLKILLVRVDVLLWLEI